MIRIYTDGSSRHADNKWYGAYAVAVYDGDTLVQQIAQTVTPGTNNASEMIAVLRALTIIRDNYPDEYVKIITDSKYVIGGFTSDYKTNVELWKLMKTLSGRLNIELEWVKGHHKDKRNKHVDKLAHRTLRRKFIEC